MLLRYESIDSTHEEAKRQLQASVVVAQKQTKGHGQGDKSWWSPDGMGLYVSFIKPIPQVPHEAITSLLGNQIVHLLRRYTLLNIHHHGINDIYLDNRKLGGILCEIYDNRLIVSIGLNLFRPNKVRKDLQRSAIWLNEFGAEHLIDGNKLIEMIERSI